MFHITIINKCEVKYQFKIYIKQTALVQFEEYCANSTIHGVRYFGEKKRHWMERYNYSLLPLQTSNFKCYIQMLVDRRFCNIVVLLWWINL